MRKGAELLLIKPMIRYDNTVCAAENTRIQIGLSDFLFYSKSCFTFKSKPKSYVESAEHPTSALLESLCDQTCSTRPDVNLLCHSRDFFFPPADGVKGGCISCDVIWHPVLKHGDECFCRHHLGFKKIDVKKGACLTVKPLNWAYQLSGKVFPEVTKQFLDIFSC